MNNMKVIGCLLFFSYISISKSHFSVENPHLGGVYSNVCLEKAAISEQLRTFAPRSSVSIGQREVIISPLYHHALAFGVNLLASLVNIGKLDGIVPMKEAEFIFIIYDDQTMDMCDSFFLPCWIPMNLLSVSNYTVVNSFRHRLLVVPDVVNRLLKTGAHVLYTEADSVWLRSPYDVLHTGNPRAILLNGEDQVSSVSAICTLYSC